MKAELLTDFESAIELVANLYFFGGFFTGFIVCTLIAAFAYFLNR